MSLEFNKAAAAVLVTGIVVMASGIVADKFVHPEKLEKNAYVVEGVGSPDGDAVAPAPKAELPPIAALLADASVEEGKKVGKKCIVCHSFEQGGANKVGPNLWNTVGRKPGSVQGFAYSQAMQDMSGRWDVETLNKFFYKPKELVPGTKMVFAGLRKEKDRANLIKYLQSLK